MKNQNNDHIKITGHFKLVSKDKYGKVLDVVESLNIILDGAHQSVAEMMSGLITGTGVNQISIGTMGHVPNTAGTTLTPKLLQDGLHQQRSRMFCEQSPASPNNNLVQTPVPSVLPLVVRNDLFYFSGASLVSTGYYVYTGDANANAASVVAVQATQAQIVTQNTLNAANATVSTAQATQTGTPSAANLAALNLALANQTTAQTANDAAILAKSTAAVNAALATIPTTIVTNTTLVNFTVTIAELNSSLQAPANTSNWKYVGKVTPYKHDIIFTAPTIQGQPSTVISEWYNAAPVLPPTGVPVPPIPVPPTYPLGSTVQVQHVVTPNSNLGVLLNKTSVRYTTTISAKAGNTQNPATYTTVGGVQTTNPEHSVFTEAALYANNRIFAMKTFAGVNKTAANTITITWDIIF